jgi:hypothetical protein
LRVVLLAVDGGFTHGFCVWHEDGREREMRKRRIQRKRREERAGLGV